MGSPSRRDALKLGALGVAAFPSLAACSSSSPKAPSTATASASPGASLEPFVPSSVTGPATGLPKRVAWASTADSEFFLALGDGMKKAAADRGVDYVTATSGADPSTHVKQISTFLARGVGALAFQPLDPAAEQAVLTQAIGKGTCAQGIITSPCTLQIAASQYDIGHDQGKAAADWVTATLGGTADVLYFNLDTLSPQLKLRHQGVLDGLKTGGAGIRVVTDVQPPDISTEGGFKAASTALQAHPAIRVVMGGDTLVVGAYQAFKQAGKLDGAYFSGVDGDKGARDLIKQGGAYKLSIAFAWELMGYGLGQLGADWIAGKQVPRVMVAKGVQLGSPAVVTQFEADAADPASVYADLTRYQTYLPLLGSVSHATRQLVWTSDYTLPSSTP